MENDVELSLMLLLASAEELDNKKFNPSSEEKVDLNKKFNQGDGDAKWLTNLRFASTECERNTSGTKWSSTLFNHFQNQPTYIT